jgi:hypothetical protein
MEATTKWASAPGDKETTNTKQQTFRQRYLSAWNCSLTFAVATATRN